MDLSIELPNAPKQLFSVFDFCRCTEVCASASRLARVGQASALINVIWGTVLSWFGHGLGEPTTAGEVGVKVLIVPPKPRPFIAGGDFDS